VPWLLSHGTERYRRVGPSVGPPASDPPRNRLPAGQRWPARTRRSYADGRPRQVSITSERVAGTARGPHEGLQPRVVTRPARVAGRAGQLLLRRARRSAEDSRRRAGDDRLRQHLARRRRRAVLRAVHGALRWRQHRRQRPALRGHGAGGRGGRGALPGAPRDARRGDERHGPHPRGLPLRRGGDPRPGAARRVGRPSRTDHRRRDPCPRRDRALPMARRCAHAAGREGQRLRAAVCRWPCASAPHSLAVSVFLGSCS